ncbi:MAG: SAM-dependent methyltransferase, partial [Myxococcota bacterium]
FVAMRCPACAAPSLGVSDDGGTLVCAACDARFPGLVTVPDLAVQTPPGPGPLRGLGAWEPAASWVRFTARPAVHRWLDGGRSGADRDAWITAWLRPVPGPVLDLFAGSGGTARALARWMGVARVIGVDSSLALLQQTQRSTLDPGLAYLRAADHHLPFQDGVVGAVQAMSGLHQAHDPLALVAEVGRVLAPGGTFVGAVAVDEGPSALRLLSRVIGEPPVSRVRFVDAVDAAGMALVSLQRSGIVAQFAARRR